MQDLNTVLEKASAELKKLDKLKDEFIGVVAHELRTPIHPILGYASMARDGMVSKEKALDMVYNQAPRLRQLANDILDVSRIEWNFALFYENDKDSPSAARLCRCC